MNDSRCGIGFDAHAFAKNRRLVLGGVEIEYRFGLAGHSDADVLVHAIIDALFGATGLGDIGTHFPDTDEAFKDISSLLLLENARDKVLERDWQVGNVDATIIAQKPRLGPYIDSMRSRLAATLKVGQDRINIKATTTEKMGFTGREEGLAAVAIVSVYK